MVAQNPQGLSVFWICILYACKICEMLYQGENQVAVVIGGNPLEDCCQPLQPHAGVNIGMGQGVVIALFVFIKLGKDQVPNLQIAVTVATRFALRTAAAKFRAQVDINLGTGTAGATPISQSYLLCPGGQCARQELPWYDARCPRHLILFIYRNPELIDIDFQILNKNSQAQALPLS